MFESLKSDIENLILSLLTFHKLSNIERKPLGSGLVFDHFGLSTGSFEHFNDGSAFMISLRWKKTLS